MANPSPDVLAYAFAFTVVLGGLFGYISKGSLPSLAAGIIFGGILALGATQTTANYKNVWVLLVTSLILATIMMSRYFQTGKLMPAGLVAGLSMMMVLRCIFVLVVG